MMHLLLAAGHGDVPAHAADAAHSAVESAGVMDINILPAITGLVVFLIGLGFLGVFVWPKITKGLDDRNDKILGAIKEAETAREQAKQALAEYESSLAQARTEANQMIADAKANAARLSADLRTKSEAELADLKVRAQREIESARQSAVASLHEESANLATAIAAKILQREVGAQDQQRLITDSLAELGQLSR